MSPFCRPLALAAAVGLVATRAAIAVPSGFLQPSANDHLEPSAIVEVFWTLDSLPPDDSELELVLSLDGGSSFPVRVTTGLDPATRRVFWRVPSLPSAQARLAVRSGAEGEPAAETIRLVSPPFTILATSNMPIEDLFAIRSEWRTREALTPDTVPEPGTGLGHEASEQIHSGKRTEVAAGRRTHSAELSAPLAASAARVSPDSSPRPNRADFPARSCRSPLRE
jgi:hypothetical protein